MQSFKFVFLIFISILFTKIADSQTLLITEEFDKSYTNPVEHYPGKILLVFESELSLEFDSSMEYLDEPVFDGKRYYLFLNMGTALITVKYPDQRILSTLPFGQMSSNSYPSLKHGEKKYFIVSLIDKLILFDETEERIAAGTSDNQMLYEREALLIFSADPAELSLEFSSTIPITEVRHNFNRYLVYIKPSSQAISILAKETLATAQITIEDINTKDVRYYFIALPDYLRENKSIPKTPDDFLKLAYQDNQIGNYLEALENLSEYFDMIPEPHFEIQLFMKELLLKAKGQNETIRYYEDQLNKNKKLINHLMYSLVKDDYENIKMITIEYPNYLPAKLIYIKGVADYFRKNGFNISNGTSDRFPSICSAAIEAEESIAFLQLFGNTNTQFDISDVEFTKNFISENDITFLNGWANQRKAAYEFHLQKGIREGKNKEEIIENIWRSYNFINCSKESINIWFEKNYSN